MANIEDVARAAGVSKSTVSNVMNNRRQRVSHQTRMHVLEVARALGYVSNHAARSLKAKRSHCIALLFPNGIAAFGFTPFSTEFLNVLSEKVEQRGYSLLISSGKSNLGETDDFAVDLATSGLVDGFLLMGLARDDHRVALLRQCDAQFVALGRPADGEQVSYVTIDETEGAKLAVRHLIDLGHERIGCMAFANKSIVSSERLEGYRQALAEAGIDYDEQLVQICPADDAASQDQTAQQLLGLENPPTAVYCMTPLMALSTIKVAFQTGLSVPEDLSVIANLSRREAAVYDPSLTGIDSKPGELAAMAVDILIDRIEDSNRPPTQTVLPAELIVRYSCRPRTTHRFQGAHQVESASK